MPDPQSLIPLLLAYLIGSIPFGLLLTRAAGLGDIRAIGSGNIGATNVMRTGRKGLGILTLLLDGGKGFAAVALARHMQEDAASWAGLAAVLGHVFPLWLRFKGGKGVATALGALFGVDWMVAAAACALWLLVFVWTRFSSLASIAGLGCAPLVACLLDSGAAMLLGLALAAVILFTHRRNIRRLMNGTELAFRGSRDS